MTQPNLFGRLNSRGLMWVLFLLVPALYFNLGMLPLGGDESIRALVSLEMMISGDYLTPTLNGELYFNKPPLFNWLLIIFFKVFNSESEFICRLPTTIFLIVYCFTIFWWVKKQFGYSSGVLAALMFLTCGRVLFRDSFLGLIDMTYSWLIFLNFMFIWYYFEKKNFLALFLISYVITAVTFLLKGLPSLAFQGITLLVLFISEREFKKLISWQHLSGIFVFFFLLSAYYIAYYLKHPGNIDDLLLRLVSESTQKSAAGATIGKTIRHFFRFPYEIMIHFAPWTLLVILLFNKPLLKHAFKVPFLKYCLLVFGANILIYWTSHITYMRYLLMLFPLIFIFLLQLAKIHAFTNSLNYRIVRRIFLISVILLFITNTFLPVIFKNELPVNHVYLKTMVIMIFGLFLIYGLYFSRQKMNLFYTMALMLLLSRIAFNLFLVPYRQIISWGDLCRKDAIHLAKETLTEDLFIMTDTITIPSAYYITRERKQILRLSEKYTIGPYYIVEDTAVFGEHFKKEYSMRIPVNKESYYAGRFSPETEP